MATPRHPVRGAQANDGGSRCTSVETVLDEMEATRYALDMGHEGDVVVVCVDHANDVWKELQRRQHGRASVADASGNGALAGQATDDEAGDDLVPIEVGG